MYGLKNVRNRHQDALAKIGWERFEVMLAEHYAGLGWTVEHVGTGSGRSRFDGGIDLKLRKDAQYVLVQCKHWNAKQVTHNSVHELLGIKINESACGAILITSGEFTSAAKEAAARQGHVELIDGDALRAMLGPLLLNATQPASLISAVPATSQSSDHRWGRSRARPGRNSVPSIAPLIKIVVAGVAALMLVQCFPRYIQSLVAPSTTQAPVLQPSPAPPAPEVAARQSPVSARAAVPSQPFSLSRQQEEEALREWQRRNAESMKILEETTPEL